MTDLTLGQRIKRQFHDELMSPFPLEDVRKLRSLDPGNYVLLHGQLEMYLSFIAGYASSADRLGRRSRAELIEGRKRLSQSFFERYPSLAVYRAAITQESTPKLFRELESANKLREELLVVIDEILGEGSAAQ